MPAYGRSGYQPNMCQAVSGVKRNQGESGGNRRENLSLNPINERKPLTSLNRSGRERFASKTLKGPQASGARTARAAISSPCRTGMVDHLREPGQSYSEGSSVAQKPVGPELNLAEFALTIITR